MEETERRTTMEDLYPELLESILCRLPLISRARLKCVCKTWCNLITGLRHSIPPTTSSGLVIFLKDINNNNEPNLNETTFIKLQEQCQDCTLHGSTKHKLPWLIDSCNGLLLYAKNDNRNWSYYISSHVLDQFIPLPQRHQPSIHARESLAFDGLHQTQFKVICYFCEEVDVEAGTISCETFSARRWEWIEHQAPLMNCNLLLEDGFQRCSCFGPSVYSKGRLYWIWSLCMLVYDDDSEFFKLVRLPKSKAERKSINFLFLRLWESEGRIHYCEPTEEGFQVWIYIDDDDDGDGDGDDNSYDRSFFKYCRTIDIRNERLKLRIGLGLGLGLGLIGPCAFNEELQVLYLNVPPGTIFAYSFETRKLAEVWCYGKPGEDYSMSFIYPFRFNSVNLLSRN